MSLSNAAQVNPRIVADSSLRTKRKTVFAFFTVVTIAQLTNFGSCLPQGTVC